MLLSTAAARILFRSTVTKQAVFLPIGNVSFESFCASVHSRMPFVVAHHQYYGDCAIFTGVRNCSIAQHSVATTSSNVHTVPIQKHGGITTR